MAQLLTTDRQVAALKPAEKRYERGIVADRELCVIVYPSGTKTFVIRYAAMSGVRRRHTLGNYPALSLADARAKAAAIGVRLLDGADPAAERVAAREAARTGETVEELSEHYWRAAAIGLHGGRRRPKRPGVIAREQAIWRTHILKKLGARRYKEVRRADIKVFMRDLAAESGLRPASIATVGGVLSNIFAYAVHEDQLEANPVLGLTRPLAVDSRTRMFDDRALGVLQRALIEASPREAGEVRQDIYARMGPTMALALRLLMLTLTRRTEAAGAMWSEFDPRNRVWTIPAERSKSKRAHVVPLSDAAMEVLKLARVRAPIENPYVFPSPKDPAQHLEPHAVTRAIARLCERHGLAAGSPHDIRRSGATTLTGEAYSVRRFIVGRVLGHNPQDGAAVTSVYDRNEYLADKRAALNCWAEHLKKCEEDRAIGPAAATEVEAWSVASVEDWLRAAS